MAVFRIGRGDSNDIVLPEASVSREHAELTELGGGRFQIRDLGSTYGISVWNGQDWQKLTEAELRHDAQIKIGEYQTTVADLMRDLDRTVVRAKSGEASATAPAPAPAAPPPAPPVPPADPDMTEVPARAPAARTAPPAPPPPRPAPSKPAPPRPAPPRPAAPSRTADPATGATMPPQPAKPAFQFLRDLPPEKRILVWLGAGFAGFLLISLITLILALAL